MKCTLFLPTKYNAGALHHISRNAFMDAAQQADPETVLFLQINTGNPLLLLYLLCAFPFKVLLENKAQNILTYQNDAFKVVSPKPKLGHSHGVCRKGYVLHFTSKARQIKQKHWKTTPLLSVKKDISTGMGSHGSKAFGASPLETTHGGN